MKNSEVWCGQLTIEKFFEKLLLLFLSEINYLFGIVECINKRF